jgi:DNA-binding response OmpR family regulator
MQIRFLTVDSDVRLLGFPLRLTPTENKLLSAIAENGRMTVEALSALLHEGVSRGNVAVHINAINRKAKEISSRRLIIFKGNAYQINPYM